MEARLNRQSVGPRMEVYISSQNLKWVSSKAKSENVSKSLLVDTILGQLRKRGFNMGSVKKAGKKVAKKTTAKKKVAKKTAKKK